MSDPISKPMLFSPEMVRALLDGRKTQTRRVMKTQPADDATELAVEFIGKRLMSSGEERDNFAATYRAYPDGGGARWAITECPHPFGSLIWCKEAHQFVKQSKDGQRRILTPEQFISFIASATSLPFIEYAATPMDNEPPPKWRPPIFMPRWASRITLEVTAVKVERLNDIGEADAKAEGGDPFPEKSNDIFAYTKGYMKLWESINGKGSWALNPWVWCYTFRRVKP